MDINVRELLGDNFSVEDAILLREYIKNNLNEGITLDFEGVTNVSTNFLTTLFSEFINKVGRNEIFNAVNVKNLSNYSDYSRVVLGTTFV